MIEHPESLSDFVAGRLSEVENTAIITHLAECEKCLARVDHLWDENQPQGNRITIPILSPDQARRLEQRLLRRMHRSDLGGQAIRLSTQGLVLVLMALLQPLLGRTASSNSNGGQPND